MDAPAVETEGLTRTFGPVRALDGVDLRVPVGTVYGVLGPNGAGKTTAIRILATLLRPTAGTARVLGHDVEADPDAVRERISLTSQAGAVDADLTGLENLIILGRLLGLTRSGARRRAGDLLEAFGLDAARNRAVRTWSGGMRRRLDLAASIVAGPDLLFLDEPTTGLDPRSRSDVWAIISALVGEGTTVLLTTQYLDEADHLADRIAVFDRGRVVAEGTPVELKSSISAGVLHLRVRTADQSAIARGALAELLDAPVEVTAEPLALSVPVTDPRRALEALTALARRGVEPADFALDQPSLDEVFLALTGRPPRQEGPDGEEVA